MHIVTKYNLGDDLWVIQSLPKNNPTPCPCCLGKGRVLLSGEDFQCPKYCNRGQIDNWTPGVWQVQYVGSVGQVRTTMTTTQYVTDTVPATKYEYMTNMTGINSGTIWPEDRLFLSHDEAQAECDRRNAEQKA